MRHSLAVVFALVAGTAFADEPLPKGAVARLGSTQFRTSGTGIVLSPNGMRAAVRVGDGIDILNLATGEVAAELRDPKKLKHPRLSRGPNYFSFAFAANGKELVSATNNDAVWVWDTETGKPLRSIAGPVFTDFQNSRKANATVATVFNCQLGEFVICETSGAGWQKLDVKTGKWTDVRGGYDRVSDVSPDGRWITDYTDMASVENYVGVTDSKFNARVYDGESGGDYPFRSTPSPDGSLVACTTDEVGPQVWDVATKKETKLKGLTPKATYGRPAFSADGKTLIVDMPGSVYDDKTQPHFARWDVTTGARMADWQVPVRINSWAIDHKNKRLVAIAGQCVIRIDTATGKALSPPEGFAGAVRPAISADGKFAAAGDSAGALRVWAAPFERKPKTLRETGSPVDDAAFSPDGKTLYASHADRSVSVWDVASDKQVATLKGPIPPAETLVWYRRTRIAISPDGKTLMGEATTQAVWAWDVGTGKVLWKEDAGKDGRGITGCRPVFTPDGSAVYYGRPKGEISKLDPRTGKELARLAAPVVLKVDIYALALSPDGKQLAVHAYRNDGELVLFDIATGKAQWSRGFKLDEAIGGLAITPDGATVVTTHAGGLVRGWNATDGEPTFTRNTPPGYLSGLQLTADGTLAVTGSPDATALVWKLK